MLHKKIVLGITGGIAAYKCAELVRLLKKQNHEVRVVLSDSATRFITPETLEVLSGHRVYQTLWDDPMAHIHLSRWADLIVIAPATAHIIAQIACGLAPDLLTTLCVASTAPIGVAPAMNVEMWQNSVTQHNVKLLKNRGITILGPDHGIQACGENGLGRLLEPDVLAEEINALLIPTHLKNKKILITAGPTHEPIDPVRYIGNRSSGKMGYALANAASAAGGEVTLISGPTHLTTQKNIHTILIKTATEMHDAVLKHIDDCDIFISAAAVSDYRAENINLQKIKKQSGALTLSLIKNPDILKIIGAREKKPFLIGFAAETENLLENAQQKLHDKRLDMIIANEVGNGKGFDTDMAEVHVITPETTLTLPKNSKKNIAQAIIRLIPLQNH